MRLCARLVQPAVRAVFGAARTHVLWRPGAAGASSITVMLICIVSGVVMRFWCILHVWFVRAPVLDIAVMIIEARTYRFVGSVLSSSRAMNADRFASVFCRLPRRPCSTVSRTMKSRDLGCALALLVACFRACERKQPDPLCLVSGRCSLPSKARPRTT